MEESKPWVISWPSPFRYNKLSSSAGISDSQRTLLDKPDHHYQSMEVLSIEIEANREKNAFLERRNDALEKKVRELRAAIYKIESRAERAERQATALQADVNELKSAFSRLESRPPPPAPPLVPIQSESNVNLSKEVNKLTTRIVKLELDTLIDQSKQELQQVVQKTAELEGKLAELKTSFLDHLSASSKQDIQYPGSMSLLPELKQKCSQETIGEMTQQTSPMTPEPDGSIAHDTNALESYLIVLIFLVSILIGASI